MKKLVTNNNGGFPFVLDDIRWMNQGINESINALVSPYLEFSDVSGLIQLSGFKTTVNTPSPLNQTIGSGYIFINDEIYFCSGLAAHNVVSGKEYRVKILTEYDELGDKLFQSGVRHDTYANRYVELIYEASASPTAGSFAFPTKSVMDAIYENIHPDLVNELLYNSFIGSQSFSLYGYKDYSGVKHLSGSNIVSNTGSANFLPLGFRPLNDMIITVPLKGGISGAGYYPLNGIAVISVKSDGQGSVLYTSITPAVGTSFLLVSLDSISYL